MTDAVAPEYARFIADERRAKRVDAVAKPMAEGEVFKPVTLEGKQATTFLQVAARRASGLFRPSKHDEVVWVQGDSELAVSLTKMDVQLADGLIRVTLPVRCDQTGDAVIEVVFAVGSAKEPSGLYASTYRRPNGPAVIVDTWGEALVAFAWQCVLGMVSGIAGAVGKDTRGNVLVPAELIAANGAMRIVPMARHRFAGSTGLKVKA
ncbi:hypothetical protein [Variovorax rhizosphaerae]|uniref:Uncharacterized protein n=1 Tax=Variovorax rhizosphaerae TaxID=1836200 RepID=A0ABU8WNI9_9BURK